MDPIAIPDAARIGRPECRSVSMGPPPGVSDADCGTVEMLISPFEQGGLPGRRMYAYFQPPPAELGQLRAGGFIEFCQVGQSVQPFSAAVWPGAEDDPNRLHDAAALLEVWAIGDEGEQRERTIARLMLHATGERYADAPNIAQHALDGSTGENHYRVAQAIIALRIELPA
jgi:hypothetical protein